MHGIVARHDGRIEREDGMTIMWKGPDPDENLAKEFTGETDRLDVRVHRASFLRGWSWEIRDRQDGCLILQSSPAGTMPSIKTAKDKVQDRVARLGDPTRSDIVGLARFSRTVDRRLTKTFVGRESEMHRVREVVDEVVSIKRDGEGRPAAGSTMLITGVPGAGKTALLDKMKEDWKRWAPESTKPLAAEIPLDALGNRRAFVDSVLKQLPGKAGWGLLDRLSKIGIGAFGFGIDVELAKREKPEMPETNVFRQPIVLMIDEVQNVSAKEHGARLLEELHLGLHGAVIIPVLAGLANSKAVIEAAGVSRLYSRSVLVPGALDRDEVVESVSLFMDVFRLEDDRHFWAERIANWSDGWPIHLHNGLSALAEMLATDAVDGVLGRVDAGAVRREAYARRATYYGDRTSGPAGRHRLLLARVMREIPRAGIFNDECEEMIAKAAAKGGTGGTLPDGMSPKDMFDEMLRKGLIQGKARDADRFVCPIPSMQSWCVARSGGYLHMAAQKGDAHEMAADVRDGENPNGRDIRGRTPLHWAAKDDWPDVAAKLLELESDVNARDKEGKTPLHLAAEFCRSPDMVKLLFDNGADPHAQDKKGKTPLQLAEENAARSAPGRAAADIVKMLMAAPPPAKTKDDVQSPLPPLTGCWVRRDMDDGVPGFDLKGGPPDFSVRVERRDMMTASSAGDRREVVVLGEDHDRWSYVISEVDSVLLWGTGYETNDDACSTAIKVLDSVLDAKRECRREAVDGHESERSREGAVAEKPKKPKRHDPGF